MNGELKLITDRLLLAFDRALFGVFALHQ